MVKAIVGANWGDEGKEKITDLWPRRPMWSSAFRAGPTPGTPSSVTTANLRSTNCPRVSFYPHTTNIIGNGVALDVKKFLAELKHLADGGVPPPISSWISVPSF